MNNRSAINRRTLIKILAALSLSPLSVPGLASSNNSVIKKPIPSSGELLPVIGLGTSRTFDVGVDDDIMKTLQEVLQQFFTRGGGLIDSSPMYGNAEQATGQLLKGISDSSGLFAATKVWTDGRDQGVAQMNRSFKRMGVEVMDLMQIHNLRDWQIHLKTLRDWKQQGKIRYTGITTSHGRNHQELESIMKKEPLDFIQLSYNVVDREVERRLLPLARDKGIAVLVNRPFQRGSLFDKVKGQPLPAWAKEFDCVSWGQFFLKYTVSHSAVTCAIPATAKLHHMIDNMGAVAGRLPNAKHRKMMEQLMNA